MGDELVKEDALGHDGDNGRIPTIPKEDEKFKRRKGKRAMVVEEGEISDNENNSDLQSTEEGESRSSDESPGMSHGLPNLPSPDLLADETINPNLGISPPSK